MVALVAAVVMAFNIALDPWGLFRDPKGRKLPVNGDARVAKYLLSTRYVQANFNGILIGSSITANWDMRVLKELRIYNESLNGGNAAEEQALVEQAVSRPGIEVAFVIQDPYFTSEHVFRTVKLDPGLWWSSLGSDNLFSVYKDMARRRLGQPTVESIDPRGTYNFDHLPTELNSTLREVWKPGTPFEIDPVAAAAYRDMVAALRAHHVQIIFVIPPVFEGILQPKREALREYGRTFAATHQADDLMLDFTASEFQEFRGARDNFFDGVHVVPKAAEEIVLRISRQLDDWLAQGRFRLKPAAKHARTMQGYRTPLTARQPL